MRWSWPSWLAILLGVLFTAFGMYHQFSKTGDTTFASALMVGGAVLLAAGLHALQSSCNAWCGDDCSYGNGCDCQHCDGCKGDDCCGKCGCMEEGHEGHGHDGGHSH